MMSYENSAAASYLKSADFQGLVPGTRPLFVAGKMWALQLWGAAAVSVVHGYKWCPTIEQCLILGVDKGSGYGSQKQSEILDPGSG